MLKHYLNSELQSKRAGAQHITIMDNGWASVNPRLGFFYFFQQIFKGIIVGKL